MHSTYLWVSATAVLVIFNLVITTDILVCEVTSSPLDAKNVSKGILFWLIREWGGRHLISMKGWGSHCPAAIKSGIVAVPFLAICSVKCSLKGSSSWACMWRKCAIMQTRSVREQPAGRGNIGENLSVALMKSLCKSQIKDVQIMLFRYRSHMKESS